MLLRPDILRNNSWLTCPGTTTLSFSLFLVVILSIYQSLVSLLISSAIVAMPQQHDDCNLFLEDFEKSELTKPCEVSKVNIDRSFV